MERELMLTGIGGQGVQLAAQLLARAAVAAGRHVSLFGSYGGMMRGGNTDATLVVADRPVESPPTVSESWSALVMHDAYMAPTLARLRPDGLLVVNTTVVHGDRPPDVAAEGRRPEQDGRPGRRDPTAREGPTVRVPASALAIELGNPAAATMVALGAYAAATGLVDTDTLVATVADVLPPYRRRHVAVNGQALRTGAAQVPGVVLPAWPAENPDGLTPSTAVGARS